VPAALDGGRNLWADLSHHCLAALIYDVSHRKLALVWIAAHTGERSLKPIVQNMHTRGRTEIKIRKMNDTLRCFLGTSGGCGGNTYRRCDSYRTVKEFHFRYPLQILVSGGAATIADEGAISTVAIAPARA